MKTRLSNPYLARLICPLVLASAALPAFAAPETIYWDANATGTTSASPGNWNTLTNWSTNSASADTVYDPTTKPDFEDDVVFNITGSNPSPDLQYISLNATDQAAKSLTFISTGTTTIQRASSTASSTSALTVGTGGLTVDSLAGPVTIGSGADSSPDQRVVYTMNGSSSITHNGVNWLTISRGTTTAAASATSTTLTFDGAGSGITELTNAVTQGTNTTLSANVNTSGTGILYLRAANTNSGNFTLTQGKVAVRASGAFGTGTLIIKGGQISTVSTIDRGQTGSTTIEGDFTLGGLSIPANPITGANALGTRLFFFSGPVDLAGGTRTITATGAGGRFDGVVSNGGITLGTGSTAGLTLGGANTYAGDTTVNGGTLNYDAVQANTSNIIVNGGTVNVRLEQGTATGPGNQSNKINTSTPLALGGGVLLVTGQKNQATTSANWTASSATGLPSGQYQLNFAAAPAVVVGQPISGGGLDSGSYVVRISGNNLIVASSSNPGATGTMIAAATTTTSSSQTFASTTLNAGASSVTANLNNGSGTVINLGAITRNAGATVRFTNPSGTLSATNGITTSSGSGDAILTDSGVAYGTVSATDWAAKDPSNAWIVALSSISGAYTAATTTALSGNADISVASQNTALADNTSITSLRFNQNSAHAITAATGKTLTTGGILVGSGVTTSIQTITGGNLMSAGSGKDLPVIVNSTTGGLSINSTIIDNGSATGLSKFGTGKLTLGGTNTYTGETYVNAGTLVVTGSLDSAVTLAKGASLSGSGTTTGTLALNGGSTIVGAAAGNSFKAETVTASSSVNIVGNDGSGTTGSRTMGVVRYNTGTGPDTASFSTTSYRSPSLSNVGVAGGETQLAYTSEARKWNAATGTWAVDTVGWQEGDFKFFQGDVVTFDDSGTGGGSARVVTLNSQVTPGGVTFNNTTTTPYTVSGSGSIAGATGLTKSGTGTVTLSTTNTYTGLTTVSGGTLTLGNAADTLAGPITVSGGTLNVDNPDTVGVVTLTSAGTISGDSALTGSSYDFQNGTSSALLAGSGATLIKSTGDWVVVSNSDSTYGGGTFLNAGRLGLRASNSLGTGTLTINGGTIGSVVSARSISNPVVVNSNFQIGGVNAPALGNADTTFNGAVDLTGATRTITLASSATFNGIVSNGGLTITGATRTLTLGGNSTYTDPTNVNSGTLNINGDNSLATGQVNVAAGAILGGNGTSGGALVMAPTAVLSARITDWTGAAGVGYNDLAVASLDAGGGALTIALNTTGLTNFTETNKSFPILNTIGGISNFPTSVTITPTGFTGTGTWALVQNGNSLELQYTAAVDPYQTWIDPFAVADESKGGDPDNDGTDNLMEFVLNGNPGISDTNILPDLGLSATEFTFSYVRRADSTGVPQVVQYGSDLIGWTDVTIPTAAGSTPGTPATVVVGTPASGTQSVTVTIQRSAFPAGKLFARLMVGP